jgi:hypothetical protein
MKRTKRVAVIVGIAGLGLAGLAGVADASSYSTDHHSKGHVKVAGLELGGVVSTVQNLVNGVL